MRSRTTYRWLIAILAAVVLTGCHGSRNTADSEVATEPPAISPTGDTTAIAMPPKYTVVNFTATIAGVSTNGQLRMAKDSVMWVSVNKLIELGRAMATKDSVWVNAPMFDKRFSGNYADVGRIAKREVTFEELQAIALSDDAEERLQRMAAQLGIEATIRITSRKTEPALRFPFQKF